MLPTKNDEIWIKLVTGKIQHNFKFVPAGLLISRVVRHVNKSNSATELDKYVTEVYNFFEKYQNVFPDDINAIFH